MPNFLIVHMNPNDKTLMNFLKATYICSVLIGHRDIKVGETTYAIVKTCNICIHGLINGFTSTYEVLKTAAEKSFVYIK